MTTQQRPTIVGVFNDYDHARAAIDALRSDGFTDDQLGFVSRNNDTGTTEVVAENANPEKGAAAGGVTGGVVGGLLGAAAALLIPGIGPIIAGGVLGATIGGVVIGAAAGGLIGALTNMGVPEEQAQYYNEEFEAGRTLVTVNPGNREQAALDILRRNGAYDATTRTAATGAAVVPGEGATPATYDPSLGSPNAADPSLGTSAVGTTPAHDPDATVIKPTGTRASQYDTSTGYYGTPQTNQDMADNPQQFETISESNDPNAPVRREHSSKSNVMPNERDVRSTDPSVEQDRNPNTGERY